MRRAVAFALAAAACAGCDPPDAWSTPVAGLDRMLLSVWGPSRADLWAVGGSCATPQAGGTSG